METKDGTTQQPDGTAIPQDQTSTLATPQGDGTENAKDTPVTKAELEAFADTIVKRVQQSAKDRNRQVEAELKSIRTRLDGTGVQISQEQEQALREKIANDMDPQDADPQASNPPLALDPSAQVVSDQIKTIFKKAGVTVGQNDPEYKLIADALNDVNGSLAETILAASQAAAAKKTRIENNQQTAGNRTMTGGAATTGQASASNAREYWNKAFPK